MSPPASLRTMRSLFLIDVEIHAHKFTFPPPGKTSGEVHDRLCRQNEGKPVVTIGFGPDFAVLRSRGVHMNIPRMVRDLHNEIPITNVVSSEKMKELPDANIAESIRNCRV